MYFRYFVSSLLGKGGTIHLKKKNLESPSTQGALCQVSLNLAQWFRRRRWKCKKFTTTRTTTTTSTDNGQILIRKANLSLRRRLAKNFNHSSNYTWAQCTYHLSANFKWHNGAGSDVLLAYQFSLFFEKHGKCQIIRTIEAVSSSDLHVCTIPIS